MTLTTSHTEFPERLLASSRVGIVIVPIERRTGRAQLTHARLDLDAITRT